jgi:hypothetical protein
VVDVDANVTKKVSVGEVVGKITGDVEVATDGTATISELPVSKLQDGNARQLLQTDAAGTGVEWTDNVDVPGTLGVTGQSTLASAAVSDLTEDRVVIAGASGELEDSANLTFDGSELGITGTLDVSSNATIGGDLTVEGTITADLTGNADTATALETARDIGGVSFDGTANINLPGVNTAGNQDTSGNAATATKLDSIRTFAITGDVTGSASGDLASGASIATSITSGVIVDADVNASAAIAGTKIDPDFGAQSIETTGDLDINTGLFKITSSSSAIGFFSATPAAQPSAIADITSTATSGALPTPDGSITIADATTPTATELLEYCVELESKLETALAALRTLGLIAT